LNDPAASRGSAGGRLGRRWNGAWRIFATGFSFACFGIGAVLLGFTVWPVLRLSSGNRDVADARVQRAVSRSMRVFVWLMKSLGLLTYEIRGLEKLAARGQFVIANHPTLIDVVYLVGLMPEVDCIVKQALWRNVFLRWPVYWAGYISNETGEGLVAACAATLARGRSLVVFPEGTRTRPGEPLNFHRGAAQIALTARVPLRPVTITCDPITLFKGNSWFRVPPQRPHWVIAVGDPIPVEPYLNEPQALAARHLTQALIRWFEVSIKQQLGGSPGAPPDAGESQHRRQQ
jgi:1-acyl-sn-glycerol-3-phosphate acyltransferase